MLDLEQLRIPRASLGDREVALVNRSLGGEKILLVVTGSIAAIKAPGLTRTLRRYGAEVDVRATESAEQFVGPLALSWAVENGRVYGGGGLSGEVEHLARYTTYLVAPATYDFINGMAQGRADTPALATMATALGRVERGEATMLVLPCMNGDMYNALLKESVTKLGSLGVKFIKPDVSGGKLEFPGARIVAAATARQVSKSPLKGVSILVTGGPTPVPLDDVRLVTNIFRGKLGREMAKELVLRGAAVSFLLGGGIEVEDWLSPFTTVHKTYDEYRDRVLDRTRGQNKPKMMILSAAVADYRPREVFAGKIASKSPELILPPFVPTEKVVDKAHEVAPEVPIVSFKLLSRVSVEELIAEARARLETHSQIVVANRREDCDAAHQIVYIVSKDGVSRVAGTKRDVAVAIVDAVEALHVSRQAVSDLSSKGKKGRFMELLERGSHVASAEGSELDSEVPQSRKPRREELLFPLSGEVLGVSQDPDHYLSIDTSREIVIPLAPHPGAFGVARKFHTHEGVDLYCDDGAPVCAMEAGKVVAIEDFTGAAAGSPWWLDTKSVLVEGESGVVCYGEITPESDLRVGDSVVRGQQLGAVKMVLRKDKGRPRSMLHLELHRPGTTRTSPWMHGDPRPATLLDATELLIEAARCR
jgi:phosphopantothenoylcysteine decarboxylase/phosphopantothenate--cysteine ligase